MEYSVQEIESCCFATFVGVKYAFIGCRILDYSNGN